jgi:hypothetical protein
MNPATWFIPFAFILALLTLPLTLRTPLLISPFLIASTAFGAHLLWRDRRPGSFPNPLLTALLGLLALLTVALLAFAISLAAG